MIKRKKSITALLTVALSLSMIGVTSKTVYAGEYSSVSVDWNNQQAVKQAKDSNGVNWWYYKYNDGTICINGTYDLKSEMEIPAELDGCTVTGIDSLLGYENAILYKESIIGKPVNKVIIPSGVKVIGNSAFSRCANLTEIQIPESINLIASGAFNNTWLEAHRDSSGFVIVNGILIDGHKASGNVTIPSNIRCIADGAFAEYDNITSVTIPSSVKRIGERAFARCSNLTNVTIAEGVEVVANGAFAECPKLTQAKLPQSVNELGNDVFNLDDALNSTTSNSDGLIISNGVLLSAKDAKGDVSIPSNITKIQEQAFYNNKNITSVKIPSSVTEMGQGTFQGSSIQNVNIPGSIKKIPQYAFAQCTKLTNVTIGNGVETIEGDSFSESNISKINIPDSVTSIESNAFANCQNLNEVNFKVGTTLGGQAFLGTPWLDNQSKTGNFTILNGVLLKCDSNASGEIVIPDGVKEIGGSSFASNMNITSIKIPEGVTKIGEFAFSDCRNLSKIDIPSSVKTIEYGVFDFCNNVTFTGPGAEFAKNMKDSRYGLASANDSNNQSSQVNDEATSDKVNPGWSFIGDNWYYGYSDGTKKTGWLDDCGNRYYFYGNGQMATGFINLGGDYYYYLDESDTSSIGTLKTGWQKIQGCWFYFNTSSDSGIIGMMKKGWQQIDGNWYYFYYGDGIMAHDTSIDGYYVNSNGVWVK